MSSSNDDSPSHGMFWIYAGLLVGSGLSLYANIKYTFIPPRSAPLWWPTGRPWDPAEYSPPSGALVLAASWPVLLYITTEVMMWKGWLAGKGWALVRGLSMLLVAAPVANASYHHLSGLLRYWFPDDVVTVWLGPLAIDGAVLMCTAALQSKAQRRRMQRQEAELASRLGGGAPSPVSRTSLTGGLGDSPVDSGGAARLPGAPPVIPTGGAPAGSGTVPDFRGPTGGLTVFAPPSPAGPTGGAVSSPVGPVFGVVRDHGGDAAPVGLTGDVAVAQAESSDPGGVTGERVVLAAGLTGNPVPSPVTSGGAPIAGSAPPVITIGATGDTSASAPGSPVESGPFTGENADPVAGRAPAAAKLSDSEVAALAWELRPEGPFSANWLVGTFRIGTGKATRVFTNQLAPELLARAAQEVAAAGETGPGLPGPADGSAGG